MKKLLSVLAAVIITIFSVQAQEVTDGGIIYRYSSDTWVVLSFDPAQLPRNVIIRTQLDYEDGQVSVAEMRYDALAYNDYSSYSEELTSDYIRRIKFTDGPESFKICDGAIADWTDLETIDFSENVKVLEKGCMYNLPGLKHIWLRSTEAIDFDEGGYCSTQLESKPTLHVPAELVAYYTELSESDSPSWARTFLRQMSEIVAIGDDSETSPSLAIRYEDTMLILHDAQEGHRLHFSTENERTIESLHYNDTDHTHQLTDGEYTVPEISGPVILTVKLTPTPADEQ